MKRCRAPLLLFAIAAQGTLSETPPARLDGEQAFAACAACHALGDATPKIGPDLAGVVGRPAAALPDYPYSPALAASGLTWTRSTLFAFVAASEHLVPGGWMLYHNFLEPEEVQALIDYLDTPRP